MEKAFTQYSLRNGTLLQTTIKIPKIISDMLSCRIDDMHAWLLCAYLEVEKRNPKISRRKKGDLVREIAYKECTRFGSLSEQF